MSATRGPAPAARPPGGRSTRAGAWATTWLLLAFMVVNFADKAVLGLAGPEIMRDLGLTRRELGWAQAAFFSLFSLSAVGVSLLTRRVRTSVLLPVMALLWSAAQLPMLWGAAGFGLLIATRVLLGFAEGPAAPVAVHHVYGWFPQRERALPTAVLMVGAAVGVAVAAPALGAVIDRFGWRWAFGVAGFVGLLWAAVWAAKGREGPLAPPVGSSGPRDLPRGEEVPLRRVLLSGTFLTASAGAFAAYWGMSAKLIWMPDYLRTVLGWDMGGTSVVVGFAALANGMVLLGHGLLARRAALRVGPPSPASGAGPGLSMIAGAGAATVFATVEITWVRIPMLFGPMALGLVMITAAQTAVARITPPGQRGVALGVLVAVFSLGGVVSPLVLAWFVENGVTVAAGYRWGWLATAALLATCGALAARYVRPERDAARLGVPDSDAGAG
ncbi:MULTISPECIES: MFS transporter [unclassified Streptomyces]|uniref:MFS transporter n=1 Tax=unclassified Streptomyces TaxID=2593676 RepID=UPI00190428A1|nr:MFS transporter [Streptomyces sp. HSG2]